LVFSVTCQVVTGTALPFVSVTAAQYPVPQSLVMLRVEETPLLVIASPTS
jgi:hypothetical protein